MGYKFTNAWQQQEKGKDGVDAEEGMPEELRTRRLTRTLARI